ncbi:DNA repair protein Rad18 [Myriangium duriaei CBS 260.36]|uniref:DNA repair protein Rad18 n=1 Tax=Myriangium duriaei CBS 260.36 TaxID=1168546 RepID=A0A9P4J859_9PEZI|nr:DNA repair protein Rad18 [Myriangium duriaei CBS 260.36]
MQQMRQSANFKKWLAVDKVNQGADHGIIEEIYCQNFMCHAKLRIVLGPLINFIIGHNGSGKSAVLTALTITLGVKATATNRAASLKKFIREGQDSAMSSVKIKNQGELAYQHEIYGDSVIVERHFNTAGASQFKLKNANGRVISTKRADLEDLLDYFGLQLDNPLNVLSQDSARQFLSSSTPTDKYKFFLKGTQLEQLDREYRLLADRIDESEAQIDNRKDDMSGLKQRMTAAEQKKKDMDRAGTVQEKIEHFTWMHAWAQVEDKERELDQASEDNINAIEHLERRKIEAQAKSEAYAAKNQNVEATSEIRADLDSELQQVTEKYERVKEEFDKNKESLSENSTQLRHIKTDLNSDRAEIIKLKAEIKEEQKRIESASGPAQAQKLEELREAEADAEEKKNEMSTTDKQPLERDKDETEHVAKTAREALVPAQRVVDAAETQLSSLQRSRPDQMKGFLPAMANLLKAIQNEPKFREKPVGPLGLHVKLLKPEWSSIVESTFGGVLDAFVVTNTHDQAILRGLQQRCNCPGDIYIGDARPIDISRNSADEAQDTLLSILQIDHDLIRNQFIINQAAEQTVLIKDRQKAHDYMYASPKPRNTKAVLCMHDHIRGEGHRYSYTANGQRMDRVRPWTKNPRMRTDIDAQINNQREIVNDAKRRLEREQQIVQKYEQNHRKALEALKRFNQHQRSLKIAHQTAEDRLQDIRTELESFTIDDGKLTTLQGTLADAEETERINSNQYTDAIEVKDRINEVQREVKQRLDAATREVDEVKARLKKLEASRVKHDQARTLALREKNEAIGLKEKAEEAKTLAENKKARLETELESYNEQALEIHSRIPVEEGLDADRIQTRIDALTLERRRAEERIGGTREEIVQQYFTAKREWREAEAALLSSESLTNKLKKAYFRRHEQWIAFRRHIMAKAKIMFVLLLNERGFKGRLESDHENRELDIKVEPDSTLQSDRGRQAKTLSGGEKSFSTICLLLSIWEAMGSPIRCLDEFDVYMDNVNRDSSMRMMIQAARRAVGKQYILITPQAMGNVPIDHDVKVIKMSDPERGQTALPF